MAKKRRVQKGEPRSPEKRGIKISVWLPGALVSALDAEIAQIGNGRTGPEPTRSGTVRDIVARSLRRKVYTEEDRTRAYELLLKEAVAMKRAGMGLEQTGDGELFRQALLSAASKELEALSVLRSPSEEATKSALIETIALIKAATGYKHLPDVPRQAAVSTEWQAR
jgi:hypothetical protein